jgi:hypothetical protein
MHAILLVCKVYEYTNDPVKAQPELLATSDLCWKFADSILAPSFHFGVIVTESGHLLC